MVPFQNSFTNRMSTVIYLTLYLCAVAIILFAISQNKCTESQNKEIGYATSNSTHLIYLFACFIFKSINSQNFILVFFLFHFYYLSLIMTAAALFIFSELSFQEANLQTCSVSWTSRSKGRKYFTLRCEPHRQETMHTVLAEYNYFKR